ncbi:hypothetical protein HZB03_04380 [Candidatus Woesearchaeota archaeon]|nr:hypothetical protein [Candidatus Woesearchaeota archaeon]
MAGVVSLFDGLHARLEVGCIQIVWMFRKSLIFDNKGGTPLCGERRCGAVSIRAKQIRN